jgi:hypothetical protein
VGIIIWWTNIRTWKNMPCPYHRKYFVLLCRPRFSIMKPTFSYHQLPLREGDKVKITFWGINIHGKYCLCWFLLFGFKNTPPKFKRVMDWVLFNFHFVRCYIDDIVIFSLTSRGHMPHLYGGVWLI